MLSEGQQNDEEANISNDKNKMVGRYMPRKPTSNARIDNVPSDVCTSNFYREVHDKNEVV